MFYLKLKNRFLQTITDSALLKDSVRVSTRILDNNSPSCETAYPDRNLVYHRKILLEADFKGFKGQAVTDSPCRLETKLGKIMALPLENNAERALFVATLNSAMRFLFPEIKTVHCCNDKPELCTKRIINHFAGALSDKKIGLIGRQPTMLNALVDSLGEAQVCCIEDNDDNRDDTAESGTTIRQGPQAEILRLFATTDLVLTTGSAVVNGTLPELLTLGGQYQVPVYFYGASIAGTAKLMDLQRFCFFAT